METEKEQELWRLAKKRVGFKRHLATFIVVNTFLWLVWFFTDHNENSSGVPWPIFPLLGWGIGMVLSFLNAYVLNRPDSVQKEYEKLKNK